jgi:hypothetical protein
MYVVRVFGQMPLMEISRQGLCSIAVLTGILWGCVFAERLTVAHARADAGRTLDQIRELQLKKGILPVAAPVLPRRPASIPEKAARSTRLTDSQRL